MKDMSHKSANKLHKKRGTFSSNSGSDKSASNSLDWDSPSNKTGTVKRRPHSSEIFEDYHMCVPERNDGYQFHKTPHPPAGTISVGKNENLHPQNYFQDVCEFQDSSRKSELPKKVNRSGTVYEPPPPVRGFNVDVGQENEANRVRSCEKAHSSMDDDPCLTPRRIKLLSTDASQARIRSIRSFVENKYTVYKKSKEGQDAKGNIGPFHRRCYQSVCPGAILNETGRRSICCINFWNKEDQSARDNNRLSKPNCRLSYPGYAITDGEWEKYTKRLTLNWDFPREEEYLIEINGVSNERAFGSFPELRRRDGDGDKMIGAWGEKSRTVQGADYSAFKTGKVSDSDSGIASPLSPGSVYGFLGYTDKESNGCWRKNPIEKSIKHAGLQNECCCEDERSQDGFDKSDVLKWIECHNELKDEDCQNDEIQIADH